MKNNKNIIIAVAAAVVAIAGIGIGIFQWQKMNKIKAETVNWEVEGYNVALTMRMPKEKFNYKIDESKTGKPLPFPRMEAKDKDDTYKIKMYISRGLVDFKSSNQDSRRKEKDYGVINGDEKQGMPSGYHYTTKYGVEAVLYLKEDKEHVYKLNMSVADMKDAEGKSKEAFDKEEMKKMIASIRVKKDYKAPERDYVSNNTADVIVKKKIKADFGEYKVKYQWADSSSLTIKAEKTAAERVSVEIYGSIYDKTLEKAIADDYQVRKGIRKYAEKAEVGEYKVAADDAVVNNIKDRVAFYATNKGNKTVNGMVYYSSEEEKSVVVELLQEVLKNLELAEK